MALQEYQAKRDFRATPEPAPRRGAAHSRPIFVVQEHHASRLHYDFRLEADGVLKSWAIPKKPTLDPRVKRLAVHVEDHPLAYATFKGEIPAGQYGAGTVNIWDHGTYENLLAEKPKPMSIEEGIKAGRLEFVLHGRKLRGRFAMVRMRRDGKDNWLFIKMRDEFARPEEDAEPPPEKARAKSRKRVPSPKRTSNGRASSADVEITHPDKVLFPEAGITKRDVFDFYRRIADRLLPYLRDRPATLERIPEGLGPGKPYFWQKNTPDYYPDWIQRAELQTEDGKTVRYPLVNDEKTLLYLVNQGAVTFHVWFSRMENLDRPDFVLFDLDPGGAGFAEAVAVAKQLHRLLSDEEVEAFVKTSGKTGLHVLTAWSGKASFDAARSWALEVAERVVRAMPDLATVERSKAKRGRRVYVDVMQNAKGRHAVPPYVLRAVPQATVSAPLTWRELTADLDPATFTIKTIFTRLARQKRDPMATLLRTWT
jgi:bifunctional non-homologous end joining protein LigD